MNAPVATAAPMAAIALFFRSSIFYNFILLLYQLQYSKTILKNFFFAAWCVHRARMYDQLALPIKTKNYKLVKYSNVVLV